MLKLKTPVLWPPPAKSWLIGKDSDAGRDWGQEEKGTTEDEMVGWHHWLDGREFEWIPGVGDGQGGLACCDSCGRKESDMTERLNWTVLHWTSWAWKKDTVLYNVKDTKAQPLVEDAHMWQCMPDMWTNLCDWTCKCMLASFKVCSLKVCI